MMIRWVDKPELILNTTADITVLLYYNNAEIMDVYVREFIYHYVKFTLVTEF